MQLVCMYIHRWPVIECFLSLSSIVMSVEDSFFPLLRIYIHFLRRREKTWEKLNGKLLIRLRLFLSRCLQNNKEEQVFGQVQSPSAFIIYSTDRLTYISFYLR